MKLNQLFYYDESSPTFLRWKVEVKTGINYKMVTVPKGSPAGQSPSYNKLGEKRRSRVKSKHFGIKTVHRIIWELFNGPIPEGMVIDHLDGDPWNNKIENLAMKTLQENAQNQKRTLRNTSGFKGVSWETRYKLSAKAQVRDIQGKITSKSFSVVKYGIIPAVYLACQWRVDKLTEFNKIGTKYTERHIKNEIE